MFWKFNLLTSHIDTLLDKEDVTLHELLDEDDVLQECKAQNRRLIDFVIRPEHMEELVNLVTQEPPDEVDEKIRYKYPNTACELLTSDVSQISDQLATQEGLLAKVYGFLEGEGPLNPLLASFFSKVMGLLITRKSEVTLEFLRSKEDFIGQLLHHLGTSAIMDLLLRLITCIESPELRMDAISWLNELELVQKLVGLIDPKHSEDKHCNASQSLCDIIRLSREQMSQLQEKAENDPLLATLEAHETVSDLLKHMFDGEKCESVLVNGLAVIQTLLEFKKTGPEGCSEQMTSLDTERLAQGVSNTLVALTPRLKDVHQLLLDPPKQKYNAMPTTVGVLDPPLGNTRLQVARLISSLLLTNTHNINVEIAALGCVNTLVDLFLKYSWNNFLHQQVEMCIYTILSNTPTENEGKEEHPLLNQLFNDSRSIQKIMESWEDNDQQQLKPGGHRKGFMGHLTKIANHITHFIDKGNNADRIKEIIKELPDNYKERWETFVSSTLAEMNKKNTVELVGGHPLHSSSEDDDADFRDIPFPQDPAMQQAFSDYQLQQMTSNFIDQFGFNEEEFADQEGSVVTPFSDRISSINFDISNNEENPNGALFEQACNERLQQLEDPASDEEIWEEKEISFSQPADSRQSTAAMAGSRELGSEDSDNSTDSEEELDSPATIRQTTSAATEKMDIDSSEGQNPEWSAFESAPMESIPVAMDTAPVAWESAPTAPNDNAENWANFSSGGGSNKGTAGGQDGEAWADFSQFTPLAPSNLSSTQPGPRSSSPVAMDTAESTNRANTYLVPTTAPGDVASSSSPVSAVQRAASADSSISSTPIASSTTAMAAEQPAVDSRVPSDQAKPATESVPPPLPAEGPPTAAAAVPANTDAPPPLPTSAVPEKKEDNHVTNLPQSAEIISPISADGPSVTEDDQEGGDDDDFDDDDLNDNFNFLASAGLMKMDSVKEPSNQQQGNGPTAENQTNVESIRAQAKEALENYTAAASGTASSTQNGPV